MGKELCVFFDCSHMSSKHFLLLLKNACYFLLKGEKLLLILSPHRSFHSIDVFSHFFLVLIADYILNFDLFLDFFSLFYWSYTFWWRDGLFNWISTIFLFIDSNRLFCIILQLLYIFHRLYLLYQLFGDLFNYLFRRLSWLKNLLFFIDLIRTLWRHFILWIFWLKDLLHVLRWWVLRILRVIFSVWSVWIFVCLLFFDCLCTLYLLNIFSSALFLNINAIFTFDFIFTFIFLFNVIIDLIILFTKLRLVL